MIPFAGQVQDVDVAAAEYKRLLGYPPNADLSERAIELMRWAREWYRENGRPWMYLRESKWFALEGDTQVRIDGVPFTNRKLRDTLHRAGAHSAVLVAVGAGVQLEEEAQRRWRDDKPDEYFFLEMYGSAVVEHLTTRAGALLCEWADASKMAVLPHQSPGYPDWAISEQSRLFDLFDRDGLPAPLEVLESGMLRPKKSLLAVFGLTRHVERVAPLSGLIPCEDCAFGPCQFRRARYRRDPRYTVNAKALKRWAAERLTLEPLPDGSVNAVFRYEGTTCTNMGRALEFDYIVKLGPAGDGHPILEQHCSPAPNDIGHQSMCGYLQDGPALLTGIGTDRPLSGAPLGDVLSWRRPASAAGCYCEPSSRLHKWGLVLETIHYALKRQTQ